MAISTESESPEGSDSEIRRKVKSRTEDLAVSARYTYDQQFSAANFYKYTDITITLAVGFLGAHLTLALVWDSTDSIWMIAGAVSVGALEGIRLALSPARKSRVLRKSAHRYQSLYERSVDFLNLELPRNEIPLEDIEKRYRELNEERLGLNEETPDLSSFWYYYIKRSRRNGGIYQTLASETEREMVNRET